MSRKYALVTHYNSSNDDVSADKFVVLILLELIIASLQLISRIILQEHTCKDQLN
jgi:hypothetical protein